MPTPTSSTGGGGDTSGLMWDGENDDVENENLRRALFRKAYQSVKDGRSGYGLKKRHFDIPLIQKIAKTMVFHSFYSLIICLCRKNRLYLRQKKCKMCNKSVEDKILESTKKRGRGTFIFPSEFVRYGEQSTVNKALERLTNQGSIIRIGRGIYYYPKEDKVLGLGVLYPTLEDIAEAVARRDKARIVPTGLYALNRLGLSTQIPMNVVYLTDGYNRKLTLSNGATIQFKHTTPKNLAFNSHLAMLLTFALKSLGQDSITDEIKSQVRDLLMKDANRTVRQDYKLMPAWVSSLIKSLYEEE